MTSRVEAVVIGAGAVGLAVARRLAAAGLAPLVLDAESSFGTGTSSRSSEVIHAGLYYAPGSLKALLCVRGRHLLYRFCEEHGVPYRRLGKLVIAATPEQVPALHAIAATAAAVGVTDLREMDGAEAARLEPALRCHRALLSPSTGIIDSHAFMLRLLGEAEANGGVLVARTRVTRLSCQSDGWGVHVEGSDEPVLTAARVVNAAGLHAHLLAEYTEGLEAAQRPKVHYARGVYFSYGGRVPFTRLIYPVPVPGGLGTHLTLDLAGQARFGPDVEWIDRVDHGVDPGRKPAFVAAARAIWPELDPDRLQPGYAGIRPKLSGPGEPIADFLISGPAAHGLDGLVNLLGIESPGLTSSLAIAEEVAAQLSLDP